LILSAVTNRRLPPSSFPSIGALIFFNDAAYQD
jgi:hypothetical protein